MPCSVALGGCETCTLNRGFFWRKHLTWSGGRGVEPAHGCGSFMPWLCSVSTPAFSIPPPLIPPLVPLFQSKGSSGQLAFKDGLAVRPCIHAEQTKQKATCPWQPRVRADPVAVDGCPVMYLHLALFNLCYSLSTTLSSLCSFHHANNSKIFKTKFTL